MLAQKAMAFVQSTPMNGWLIREASVRPWLAFYIFVMMTAMRLLLERQEPFISRMVLCSNITMIRTKPKNQSMQKAGQHSVM